MQRSISSALPWLFLLSACSNPPTPTGQDLRGPEVADLSVPADLTAAPDLSPPPDLAPEVACMHGQTRQAGVCGCAFGDDVICAEGHCCAMVQQCLPALGSAMNRCSPPPKRQRAALAYDAYRERSLMFGGMEEVATPLANHWELDKYTWEPLRGSFAVGVPTARHGASLVYDEFNKRLLLFGGQSNATTYFNQLYQYDGTWKLLTTNTAPAPRALGGLVYDSNRRVLVLYGGDTKPGATTEYGADTWEFNVQTGNWVLRSAGGTGQPRALEGLGLAYEAKNKRTVLFGGSYGLYAYSNETWTWNGTQWTKLNTPVAGTPNPRAYFGMAYDADRGVVVLSGGETNAGLFGALADVWELSGDAWVKKTPATVPSGRLGNVMTYDAKRKMVIMAGGLQNDIQDATSDVWGWDGTNWQRL